MKKLGIAILLTVCCSLYVTAQSSVARRLRALELGKSGAETITSLFGEPDRIERKITWIRDTSETQHADYYYLTSIRARNIVGPKRTMSTLVYGKLGLTFWLFDNPSELNSIEISHPKVWSNGVRTGESLNVVLKIHGNGVWTTSTGRADWDLDYERLGVRYIFLRSPKRPQFPMRLERKRRVVRIEVYDRKVHFLG